MSKKLNLAVIFGGRSGEHEVSIVSAKSVIREANKKKYNVKEIFINKNGEWILDNKKTNPTESLKETDVVFPVLHGPFGEDGAIQGFLELSDVPYVGAGVAASAVCMDKVLMKEVFEGVGLPITRCLVFLRDSIEENEDEAISSIEEQLDYPMFTKPANLGSSVGIAKAKNRKELKEGLQTAALYDRKILVEEGVNNVREIEVSVLGNNNPEVSVCGEVIPYREFYDYDDKYVLGKTKFEVPADLPDKKSKEIQQIALKAFKSTDCSGMARVDFLIDERSKKVYISEINTIPGFTKISMYPKLWEASGLPFSNLIDELITLALERYNNRSKNKTSYPSKLLET